MVAVAVVVVALDLFVTVAATDVEWVKLWIVVARMTAFGVRVTLDVDSWPCAALWNCSATVHTVH